MTEQKKKMGRKIHSAINYVLLIGVLFLCLGIYSCGTSEVPTSNIKYDFDFGFEDHMDTNIRNLVIASYGTMVDGKYTEMDMLAELLRSMDLSRTDIILLNTRDMEENYKKQFDDDIMSYVSYKNNYCNIIAFGVRPIDYAIIAKQIYYPEADIIVYGATNKAIDEQWKAYNNNDKNFVDKTMEVAFCLNNDIDQVVLIYDQESYSQQMITLIESSSELEGKQVLKLSTQHYLPQQIVEIANVEGNAVIYLSYFQDINTVAAQLTNIPKTAIFDMADYSYAYDANREYQYALRYMDVSSDNESYVVMAMDEDAKDIREYDIIEKRLLACIGLTCESIGICADGKSSTANFLDFAMRASGALDFSNDVNEQVDICMNNNLVIDESQLMLGDLIFYSDIENPTPKDTTKVAIYIGENSVISLNQNGEIECVEPVAKKYHSMYASIKSLIEYDG